MAFTYKIKPLEWRQVKSLSSHLCRWWIADKSIGQLNITFDGVTPGYDLWENDVRIDNFRSLTKAQEAAEELHYDKIKQYIEEV